MFKRLNMKEVIDHTGRDALALQYEDMGCRKLCLANALCFWKAQGEFQITMVPKGSSE